MGEPSYAAKRLATYAMIGRRFQDGFAADMKAAGIHVGMGANPVCVNCGEPWPCPTERAGGEDMRERNMVDERRDRLGRRVREVWVAWAQEQPEPKPSWLVPYDDLDEAHKEADRRIGSALWGDGFADGERAMGEAQRALEVR